MSIVFFDVIFLRLKQESQMIGEHNKAQINIKPTRMKKTFPKVNDFINKTSIKRKIIKR